MLDEHDLGWLATLNIPPETLDNPSFIDTLNQLSRQGNIDLRSEADTDQKAAVIQARYNFFALLGLGEKITEMSGLTHTLTPPESFILLQREARLLGLDGLAIIKGLSTLFRGSDIRIRRTFEVLQELDLKPAQVINRSPKLFGFSEERIRSKIRNLEELGLNPPQVINSFPNTLGFSEESIKSKVFNLEELGLNPPQVINRFPNLFGFSEENIKSKVFNLEELGLNPPQVINRFPKLFGLSEENIKSKVFNLEELGLNPPQVINRFPNLLGLSEENIKSKFVFFQRTVKLLKWEYTAEELLNAYPILLGASFGKLQILRRLSAQSLTPESRDCPPVRVGRASTMPLEAYMIALREMDEGEQLSLDELNKQARRIQESLPQPARRAKAKTISRQANATLGRRACQMYLEYTKA